MKKIIEEDINDNLGVYYPNAEFIVTISAPEYIELRKSSNLLKKRENYLLDIGVYQKVVEKIEKSCLQKK